MTTKQEYRQFLNDNFKGLRLRKPLFYSWGFGLRFKLGVGSTDTEEYFQEATKRASTLFQTAFNDSDTVFVIFMDHKYRRQKIRFQNYTFRQIDNLKKIDVSYLIEKRLYEPKDKFDITNVAITKTKTKNINHQNILTAIGNTDFGNRQPRLDKKWFFVSKEVYFININKKLIFHMYDDRGLDIITAHKETIIPIHKIHNDWILEYDRKQIEKQLE